MTPKYPQCKDCRHSTLYEGRFHHCTRPHPFTGYEQALDQEAERSGFSTTNCGEAAKYFEPKNLPEQKPGCAYTYCPALFSGKQKKIQQWCRRVENFVDCRFYPIRDTCWARLTVDDEEGTNG